MAYSTDILEFRALLELVARWAATPMGRDRVLGLRPITSTPSLRAELELISEAFMLRESREVTWSFSEISDPAQTLSEIAVRGSSIDPLSALDIAAMLDQAIAVRRTLSTEKDSAPRLFELSQRIAQGLTEVVRAIRARILPGGEIDDSASAELRSIRAEINRQRERLKRTLESAMRSAGDAIQDPIVTMRNDRYVIPVKSDFRGAVGGVAHGFSSSGATVFIEPLAVIEANNELQNLKGREEREIARILHELADMLREHLPEITEASEAIAKLDSIAARTAFGFAFRGSVPVISDGGELEFEDGRHPLLEARLAESGKSVVPSSFALSLERPVMVISGANAGGKTVVMKTAGLLSLMALSAVPVTAKRAIVPAYRSVLADIGDRQSISADLSTFSSHISNIAGMMGDCTAPSLVLLDEVGTGTDPDEGSALGVAIVDKFRKLGAHVIASTHYRGLKQYAASDEGVLNASVEFNERTLEPTYKLLTGIAGASSGIDIAGRFGIDTEVIGDARSRLDESARAAGEYLAKLQEEVRVAGDLRIALEEERLATAAKFTELEREAEKREETRRRDFEREMVKALEEFDRQAKAFIGSIEDKALKARLEKERAARKSELNRALLERTGTSTAKSHPAPIETEEGVIEIGSAVLTPLGQLGKVVAIDRETAEVLVGQIRLREKISNLKRVATASTPSPKPKRKPETTIEPGVGAAVAELNLIGKTVTEAEDEIDKFLDEAFMQSLGTIRVIHGFGTGALKNFVHHFLKNHPHVESFGFASQDQGGNGATLVKLKF